jgi:hypothetical protein
VVKYLFVVIVAVNVWLFAVGAGWFGIPPAEKGRAVHALVELNGDKVQIGKSL